MRSTKERVGGGLLVVAMAAVGTTSCKPGKAEENKERAETVRVETIGRTDIAEILSYVADLKPYTEVKIYSPLPDRILSFPWQDGDEIRRGQLVALIRKEGLDKGIEQMMAQAEALDAQLKNLESELKRSQELLDAGVITRQTFDKVQTSYQATLAQRKALEAGRGQLAVNANNAAITAPITGVIANKMLEKGDMAVPQVPLCRILQIDKLKVELKLVERDVAKVKMGHEVRVHLDAYPERAFTGKVTTIMPFLDAGTRTNTVIVTIDNPVDEKTKERLLKPGMYGTAELVLAMREQVIAAPEPALLLDNVILEQQKKGEILRKAFVVDDEGKAQKRLVKLGARKGTTYEVLEGLNEGEQVVVRGQHGLKDGQKVEIVTEATN